MVKNDFCSRSGKGERLSAILSRQLKVREARIMRKRDRKLHPNLGHLHGKHPGSKSPYTPHRLTANKPARLNRHLDGLAKIEAFIRRGIWNNSYARRA